jgi:HPr kinase/phosphorylase
MSGTLHASAAARDGAGVLLLGPPGAGKSDLLLRLLHHGFSLVADDRVVLRGSHASAPPALAGLLEVRGLGIFRLPYVEAELCLAVELGQAERLPEACQAERLREPCRFPDINVPLVRIDPWAMSAPLRVALALDCVQGRVAQVSGVFA